MQKIVINGANGYVASHFVNELLKLNYEVVTLVRNNHKLSSEERMKRTLARINKNSESEYKNLKVVNYSLQEKNFGLSVDQLSEIFDQRVYYFHFAACLKYNAKDRDEIFRTNVHGVENSVKVFLNNSKEDSRFFLISSVYSCGKTQEAFSEKFYENEDIDGFRNYYEQSKRYAENIVRQYIETNSLNAHIIRLSQVVGNNKSGMILTDYGIFDFIKRIQKISEKYPQHTIRIKVDPEATQNLISIDNTVNYLLRALQLEEIPVIINMIGKTYIRNYKIVEGLHELLPVNLIPEKGLKRKDLSALERIVAAGMDFTGLYANTNLSFESHNLDKYFSPNGNEVTDETLYKMMENFIRTHKEKQRQKVLNPSRKN